MNSQRLEKAYISAYLLKGYPEILRAEILKDNEYCNEVGILSDATITFGDSQTSFSRNALMSAIRKAYASKAGTALVKCEKDGDWEVCIDTRPSIWIKIKGKNHELNTDIFWPLNPDSEERIQLFKEISTRYVLPARVIERWFSILSNELSDDHAADLITDITRTPAYLEQVLGHEMAIRGAKTETLVPDNIVYYERLIGLHSGSKNIIEYCENELVEHYRDKDVSYLDFIVCANSFISKAISPRIINSSVLESLIKDAITWQSPFMLIGCLEIGLSGDAETLEGPLGQAFDSLLSPEVLEQIRLISSLFVFIDGELSRLSVFRGKPSFYRRFAAFGQASLVAKVAVEHKVHFKEMEKWSMEQRGLVFFCQSFIDLRCEPRWLPGYSSYQQLRDELIGRVSGALNTCNNKTLEEELHQKLVKDKPLSINSYFSGPLEANVEPNEVPDDVRKSLEERLSGEASLDTFSALINLTQICKLDSEYGEIAASLLEKTQHQLAGEVSKEVIYQTLNGLATVAASLRSKKLAGSVMILSRVYRDYLDVNVSPENIFAVGLVSGAAFENEDEWAEYIGQWAYEVACLDLDSRARGTLFSMLSQLCILEPYLYYTCSRPLEILDSSV